MSVKIRFLIAVFLGLFFYSETALAGWVVTYKDSESGEQRQDYYSGDKMKFGESVFADDYIIVADKGSASYWKGTPKQYCNAMSDMKKKLEEQFASLPAQYRPVPISQKKVTSKKIGTKSIAGYSATGYVFLVDGINNGEFWVSSDSALSGLISMKEGKNDNFECFEKMKGMDLEDSTLFRKMEKKSFILEESWQQVVSVKKKKLPRGSFEAPDGYKGFSDFQQYMDYVSKKQSSASSSSSPSSFYQSEEASQSDYNQADKRQEESYRAEDEPEPSEQRSSRKKGDNIIANDAKDIAKDSAREVRQSTKSGIKEEISKDIKKGVGSFLKKIF